MKTVKIVDLNALCERENLEYAPNPKRVAVIIGENKGRGKNKGKVIIADDDGCHELLGLDEKYEFDLFKVSKSADGQSRAVAIIPSATTKISVQELVDMKGTIVSFEVLGRFVRQFGSRIEGNYRILLNSIKEVGLNPNDYPRNVAEVQKQELETEQKEFV